MVPHRFDANPEPTFHFDAGPDPDTTLSFRHVGKSDIFIYFYSQHQLTLFNLSLQRHRCHNFFQHFGLALHFVEPDPDPPK